MAEAQEALTGDGLILALQATGLRARRYDEGRGPSRVIVPLLDMQTDPILVAAENPEIQAYFRNAAHTWNKAFLYIATDNLEAPTQVGVIGFNEATSEAYRSEEWETVETLDEAVAAFRNQWEQRDTWIGTFTGQVGKSEA